MEKIYKFHRLPQNIASDRDKVFVRKFWQRPFKQLQVKLSLSTNHRSVNKWMEEEGNRCGETYLRCMIFHTPKD